tara:strand:+ start:246 stop:458 length:213 start_codon:yes stop_codon:yes gene_type:complete
MNAEEIKLPIHLHINGDWFKLPKFKAATTTCVFKSSFCERNTIIYSNLDDALKDQKDLKKIGIKSYLRNK